MIQHIRIDAFSNRTHSLHTKFNTLVNDAESISKQQSPNKFRVGHRVIKAGKKIKSEAQSPQTRRNEAKYPEPMSFRKSVTIKTEAILSERRRQKNIINAFVDSKGSPPPEKAKIKTSGLMPSEPSRKASQLQQSKKTIEMERPNSEHPDLTDLEKEEIKKFPVYFKGTRRVAEKKDFTDQDGNVLVKKGDSVAYRYEIIETLGKGAFGKVFKAFDHKKQEPVALKIIKSISKLNMQAKVEVEILQRVVKEDEEGRSNIVRMKGSFVFRGHSCIVYEVLGKNLYEYMKDYNFKPTPQKVLVKFSIQILHALMFLGQRNIVHCDIKPENIMLKDNFKTGLRVIDLGSSCFEANQFYTYIQSRFYRAPEIILGIRYTPAIDMWSFGLVLAQLLIGYPLFPGETEDQQLLLYMEIFGYPPQSMIQAGSRRKRFFNDKLQCRITQSKDNFRLPKSLSLERALGDCSNRALLDLIRRCLEWEPSKRISPRQALLHEWILGGIPLSIRNRHILEVTGEAIEL